MLLSGEGMTRPNTLVFRHPTCKVVVILRTSPVVTEMNRLQQVGLLERMRSVGTAWGPRTWPNTEMFRHSTCVVILLLTSSNTRAIIQISDARGGSILDRISAIFKFSRIFLGARQWRFKIRSILIAARIWAKQYNSAPWSSLLIGGSKC